MHLDVLETVYDEEFLAVVETWPWLTLAPPTQPWRASGQSYVSPLAPKSRVLLLVEEVVAFPGQNGVCQLNRLTGALLDHMTRLSAEDFMHSSL